jgi:membrane-associated protease RseP (regulator of RpoE activity)
MRLAMRIPYRSFLSGAVFLALIASSAHAAAPDESAPAVQQAVDRHMGLVPRDKRPVDPKYVPGWMRFCADNPERGGCEVILERLGRKPVVGVLFAPDPAGGVRIAGITPDGAAAGAGIRSGDRLLRIAGKPIAGDTPEARVDNARLQLQEIDDKTAVKLTYARDGRESTVSVTPKLDERIMVFLDDRTMMRPGGDVIVRRIDGRTEIRADSVDVERLVDGQQLAMGTAPQIHVFRDDDASQRPGERRVIRIECKDGDAECRKRAEARIGRPLPAFGDTDAIRSASVFRFDCKPGEKCEMGQDRLAEAFRWNGLNLASVDAQLGRYFGTDTGVLVLSTGPALGQLQAGDVIRHIDGKTVDTPRAVMDALRDKPADSTVAVEYLRDRVSASIQLKVPKAMSFPPMPPMPPAPPHPPKAGAAPDASGAAKLTHRRIVMVDKDGQVQTWEDDGNGAVPMPPAPPAPPVPPPPPRVD